MDIHSNARTTAYSRELMARRVLEQGAPLAKVAGAFGVSAKTVAKWVARFKAEGAQGLADRSSRPQRLRAPTSPAKIDNAIALRRTRRTGREIAAALNISRATVSRILRRARLSRQRDLDPPEPIRRYEHERPGDMIHLDIKKLGRFERIGHRITGDRRGQSGPRARGEGYGWEYVHVAIDDASRIAFSEIYPDEKKESAIAALKAALAYYKSLGVTVRRVMTDNGSCYKSNAFKAFCRANGLKHVRTKPYTPKTNGKAERFIQTALREWAYAQAYDTSDRRADALPNWLHRYNWHRPHGGINHLTPISRLGLDRYNLLSLHT